MASRRLREAGVQLKEARIEVEKIIGRGSGFVAVEIPFTPRAKRVLELSWKEARQLHHNYIGTEHLLLGLIREGEGVACRVLGVLGVDRLQLREQVLSSIGKTETKLPEVALVPTDTSEIQTGQPFSWYTPEATVTVQRAWGIAETAGSKTIAPVHLLLAALRNHTIYGALKAGRIDIAMLRREIFSKLEQGDAGPEKSLPFSEDCQKVLEGAWQQAHAREQFFVPTECIVLALLADEDALLSGALKSIGADTAVVRQFIEDKLKLPQEPADSIDSQTVSALDTRPALGNPMGVTAKSASVLGLYLLICLSLVLYAVYLIDHALFVSVSIAMLIILIIGLAICLAAFVFHR